MPKQASLVVSPVNRTLPIVVGVTASKGAASTFRVTEMVCGVLDAPAAVIVIAAV